MDSREVDLVDTSKLTIARSSDGEASSAKASNKQVVRPLKQSDEIKVEHVVGLKSVEHYNDDDDEEEKVEDSDDDDDNDDRKEKKKKKKKNNSVELARDIFLVVKSKAKHEKEFSLSSVLRTRGGSAETPKPVNLDVSVLEELKMLGKITAEDFRHLKNQISTSRYLSEDHQLKVGSVVIVDQSTTSTTLASKYLKKELDIDTKLKTIHEDLKQMNASMTRMETSMDIMDYDDSNNRWCWQRWWGPSSLLAQKTREMKQQKNEVDGDEGKKKRGGGQSKSISCFCWGGDDHAQLGEYEDESLRSQNLSMADVKEVRPKLSSLDRPLAMLVRQIVCSAYQTVILLHEGIVLTTAKISALEQAALSKKLSSDDDLLGGSSKSKRISHFLQIPFPKGMMPVQFIAAGGDHFLALTDDSSNNLYSWGNNTYGQLGLGHTIDKKNPCPVMFPLEYSHAKITFASCGTNFSFCVTSTNRIFSWGANDKGQLAQWKTAGGRHSGNVTSPMHCQAWDTYRENNLPYVHGEYFFSMFSLSLSLSLSLFHSFSHFLNITNIT